jgi:hypothetical protein
MKVLFNEWHYKTNLMVLLLSNSGSRNSESKGYTFHIKSVRREESIHVPNQRIRLFKTCLFILLIFQKQSVLKVENPSPHHFLQPLQSRRIVNPHIIMTVTVIHTTFLTVLLFVSCFIPL